MRRIILALLSTCLLALALPLHANAAPLATGNYPCGPSMAPKQ